MSPVQDKGAACSKPSKIVRASIMAFLAFTGMSCDRSFSKKGPEGIYRMAGGITFSLCKGWLITKGLNPISYRVERRDDGNLVVLSKKLDLASRQGEKQLVVGTPEDMYMPLIDTDGSTSLAFVDPDTQLPALAVKTRGCN
jgi:hypothetical protein